MNEITYHSLVTAFGQWTLVNLMIAVTPPRPKGDPAIKSEVHSHEPHPVICVPANRARETRRIENTRAQQAWPEDPTF